MLRRLLLFMVLVTSGGIAYAQEKPKLSLTVAEALGWETTEALALPENVSQVALADRFEDRNSQLNPSLNPKVQVLIAPDGMDNFGFYLNEQPQFNLYNFTHWAHIDVLNWFAGTADNTINIPSRPWVEAAHKNGVKVIGSVYLAVAQWGGNPDTVEAFLKRDEQGRFPMAHQLIKIAQYYGFDGWLINQETDLSAVKSEQNELLAGVKDYNRAAQLGREMLAFMTYLTQITPDPMEIHWYDAQLVDGTVRWQNELNSHSAPFFGPRNQPTSDAIFLNYWWRRDMVVGSNAFAKKLRRDPYDVYTGVDLWPARNAQRAFTETAWLGDIFSDEGGQGLTSIALFGNNYNFNFSGTDTHPAFSTFNVEPEDVQRFYDAETRLFAGDDLNVAAHSDNSWNGLSEFIPARSVLNRLPFTTSFGTGHGKKKALRGEIVSTHPWHDMSKQDHLPSWQFAITGDNALEVKYDFDFPFNGGNSLLLTGNTHKDASLLPLYKTQFTLVEHKVTVMASGQGNLDLILTLADGTELTFPLTLQKQWRPTTVDLKPWQGATVTRISLGVAEKQTGIKANIGLLALGK